MNELTKIEKRYAAINSGKGKPPVLYPDIIRNSMKKVAYHEAGHFAARLFTQLESSHVLEISIIGNSKRAGYVRSERNYTESTLKSYPPPLQRCNGYILLLNKLAGFGAEAILSQSEEWDSIFDYCECEYGDCGYEEETDFYRALQIAKIMTKHFMPANMILNLANKWTLEMLKIPAVWNVVEIVADKLIKQGKITTNACQKLSGMAYDSNFPKICELTKWKRRLFPKPGELDKYVERI